MSWRNSLHGRAVEYDKNFIYLNGKPVGSDLVGLGRAFYADSGVDGASGSCPSEAAGTIDELVAKCSANNGDKIVVMAAHTEAFTGTNLTLDVAGVEVIGIGWGSNMPRLDMTGAAGEVSVTADNVRISGLNIHANVTDVLCGIEIEDGADWCYVSDCLFDVETTATDEFAVCIRTNDASNKARIYGNEINMGLGGAVAAISFTKDTDQTWVIGNQIYGDFSTANINGLTTLSTLLKIEHNLLANGTGGNVGTEPAIELVTGSTGWIRYNDIVCNLATKAASIVADTCFLFENYYNEDITGTGGIIGTASADD
jgi:hypothetical protein